MIEKQTRKKVKYLMTGTKWSSVSWSLISSTKMKKLCGIMEFNTYHNRSYRKDE